MKKLALLVGIGIGYVLGARAGRQAYDQLAEKVHELATRPEVTKAAQSAKEAVTQVGTVAAEKVTGRLGKDDGTASGDEGTVKSSRTSEAGGDTDVVPTGDELGGSQAGLTGSGR